MNHSVTIDVRSNIDRRNMDEYHTFYEEFRKEIPDNRVTLYPGFVSDLLSDECVSAGDACREYRQYHRE